MECDAEYGTDVTDHEPRETAIHTRTLSAVHNSTQSKDIIIFAKEIIFIGVTYFVCSRITQNTRMIFTKFSTKAAWKKTLALAA